MKLEKLFSILPQNTYVSICNSMLNELYYEGEISKVPLMYNECIVVDCYKYYDCPNDGIAFFIEF